jgi:hypothetical protein
MTFVETIEFSGATVSRQKAYLWALSIVFIALILITASHFANWPLKSSGPLADFDDFYLAGLLSASGNVGRAYHLADLVAMQTAVFGAVGFMPWTYPPQFDLLTESLTLLPRGLAYLVFAITTLVGFALTIRRLAPQQLVTVMMLLAPVSVVTLRTGQNGFLSGTLIGLATLGLLSGRVSAGIPLGLMIIKPHLAVAFAVHVLCARKWTTAAVAISTVAATSLLATAVLGVGVWTAFLGGVTEAAGFLKMDLYPHFRMISAYALVRSFGLSASLGTAAQIGVAIFALAATARAVRCFDQRAALGIAAIASPMISPYAYDYDLPIYGVGVALLLPVLMQWGRPSERLAIYALTLSTQCLSLALSVQHEDAPGLPVPAVSLGCVALIATLILSWRILIRASAAAPAGTAATLPPNGRDWRLGSRQTALRAHQPEEDGSEAHV